MEFEETLYMRRSCRKYTADPVNKEDIEKIVEAGKSAPLATGDHETTLITVVTDPGVIERIRASAKKESVKAPGKLIDLLRGTNVLILVSATDISDDHIEYCNAACMIENMHLQATALGLGSCYTWGAVRMIKDNKEIKELLCILDGYELLSGLIIGHPEKPLYKREKSDRIVTKWI